MANRKEDQQGAGTQKNGTIKIKHNTNDLNLAVSAVCAAFCLKAP